MFLVGILSWWYGDGLIRRVVLIYERLLVLADFFSVGLLVSTLFAPFRQISASSVSGSIGTQIRASADRFISRFIGSFVRSLMIIVGLIVILASFILGFFTVVLWLIAPVIPIIGITLTVTGWIPQWI